MGRKLWVLMKKDLCLCPVWIVFGLILMMIMPRYILREIGDTGIILDLLLILCAIFASNLVVSRICYVEDNQAVITLLQSLPVTRKELIAGRTLFAAGLTVAFVLFVAGLGVMMGVVITPFILLVGMLIGLLYESVYLALYYKWGNQVAQYALVVVAGIVVATWILL